MSEKFYIGFDVGTTRTSIATSTGATFTIDTCIGYPKDIISQKRFNNKPYLLGREAVENRLALDMVWPLQDGILDSSNPKAMEACKIILEHLLHKAIPELSKTDEVLMAIGVPARASIESKKDILELTKGMANKVLIISEPFAVAYGMDMFNECIICDLGGGTNDIIRIHGSLPTAEDQITLTTAGNFLDNEIMKELKLINPDIQITQNIVRQIKEKYGYVTDNSEKVIVQLTTKGIPDDYDITELLKTCCLRFAEPICKAVQELVGEFDPEFQSKLRNNILIAGGGSRLKGIDNAIEKGLQPYGGGTVTIIQDSEYSGCKGALKMIMECPDSMLEAL